MPSKVRDTSPERRRDSSKKDGRRLEKVDSREHRRSSHRQSSSKDKADSKTSLPRDEMRRSSMPGILDTENALPNSDSKMSLPYPTFSKEHSKEAVAPRAGLDILTPPATDLNASKTRLSPQKAVPVRNNAPPSPPLTDRNAGRWRTDNGKPAAAETILEDDEDNEKIRIRLRPKSKKSDGRLRSSSEVGSPTKSRMLDKTDGPGTPSKLNTRDLDTPQRSVSQPTATDSTPSKTDRSDAATEISSNATSIAPEQPKVQRPGSRIPLAAVVDDQQSEVTSMPGAFPDAVLIRQRTPNSIQRPPVEIIVEPQEAFSARSTPTHDAQPPPPPPPVVPLAAPKVDYLLQHGGLVQPVPRNLLLAGKPTAVQQAATPQQQPVMVAHLFEPFNQLLDDFNKVMAKNGSLAVATGYRSVARRLLDRLEKVFARDISSEFCQCGICTSNPDLDEAAGVSWGEVLELVSGRRDLPDWPPFTFVASPVGLGISLEAHVPMQKLDVDVPEDYREHYIRQSRKTKQSVDKWLNRQPNSPSEPPEEVDEETLTFAILTHLAPELRPTLKSLLGIVDAAITPPQRIPTPELGKVPRPQPTPQPISRARPEPVIVAGHAIQRLYRISTPPRDAETALFMLNNPTLHDALATLAAVSDDEWEILTSGRFDGFLRSGAEDNFEMSPPSQGKYTPYQTNSRGPTPGYVNGHARKNGYPPRTTTPAQFGAPVALDEETEIATLAEIEREIYTGMEALEDAFEVLHLKAETVRKALRERSAGLAAAAQRRRGPVGGCIEVRIDTPASMNGDSRWEAETDDGLGDWDGVSEIAPDDSASNISSSKRRRPNRRHQRRTPALVEEDEDDYESERTESPKKR
jgi:hypothetical protein